LFKDNPHSKYVYNISPVPSPGYGKKGTIDSGDKIHETHSRLQFIKHKKWRYFI